LKFQDAFRAGKRIPGGRGKAKGGKRKAARIIIHLALHSDESRKEAGREKEGERENGDKLYLISSSALTDQSIMKVGKKK